MISQAALAVLLVGRLHVLEPPLDGAKEQTRKLLASDKYGFCHDPKYPLTDREAAWCPPVGPEKNPRCVAFRGACDAPRAYMPELGRLGFSRGVGDDDGPRKSGEGDKDAVADKPTGEPASDPLGDESGKRKPPRRIVLEPEDESTMPELGGLGQLLFWTILGLGLLLLIYVIARNSSGHQEQAAPVEAPDAGPAPERAPEAHDEQLVHDVGALLEQARAAASAGDFTRAIQRAHAALLHRLDHDGLIRVAPSRTNGDYVRDLQPKPELRGSVREIVRDVEQVQFGTARADAGLYDRVLQRIVPIATRRSDALLLLLGLSLLSCDPARTYPFDRSPSGADAVIELGAAYNLEIAFRTTALAAVDPDEPLGDADRGRTLVLLHDAPDPDPLIWSRLLTWADAGHHLVLAGVPPPMDLGLTLETGAPGHVLEVSDEFKDRLTGLDLITADDAVLRTGREDARAMLQYADGSLYAVQYERGFRGGDITVLADDRLFTNGGLMLRDNPEFVVRLLKDLGGREVELADGLLDLGADTPAEAIANTHLTPVILQILALLALLFVWRGAPFGRPRDPPSRSRRHFAEHVQALGTQYARARASRHAVRLYAAWALERLRDKTQSHRTPGLYPLAQAVAGRTGDDEARVMETLTEASTLSADAGASRVIGRVAATALAADLQLMQDLARLVRLVGGPR